MRLGRRQDPQGSTNILHPHTVPESPREVTRTPGLPGPKREAEVPSPARGPFRAYPYGCHPPKNHL